MSNRALVTGASSGIGAAFARLLAVRGTDLVIVARGRDGLENLAAELTSRHRVKVDVVPADLTNEANLKRVEDLLADPANNIDLLVNNAGYGSYGAFAELDIDAEAGQVDLNIRALVRLSHAALGPMLSRNSGAIINISSTAGAQPMAYSAVYAASKAFVTSFTHALTEELRGTGVQMLAVLPGFTRTEFHERATSTTGDLPSIAWMDPEDVARIALTQLDRGRHTVIPGALNQVIVASATVTPPSISRRMSAFVSKKFT